MKPYELEKPPPCHECGAIAVAGVALGCQAWFVVHADTCLGDLTATCTISGCGKPADPEYGGPCPDCWHEMPATRREYPA